MDKEQSYYKAYMEHRTISRRGLLRSLVKGIQPQVEPPTALSLSVIRPPGAQHEALFQQSCNGCGDCVTACPEALIIITNQRPELSFASNYCTRCQACADACPSIALQNTRFSIAARPSLINACQNTYLYCDSCADYCKKKAIQWQARKDPVLLTDLCDGCGECVFRCPTSAWEMQLMPLPLKTKPTPVSSQ